MKKRRHIVEVRGTEHTVVISWKGRQIAQKQNTAASGHNMVLSSHQNIALNSVKFNYLLSSNYARNR